MSRGRVTRADVESAKTNLGSASLHEKMDAKMFGSRGGGAAAAEKKSFVRLFLGKPPRNLLFVGIKYGYPNPRRLRKSQPNPEVGFLTTCTGFSRS